MERDAQLDASPRSLPGISPVTPTFHRNSSLLLLTVLLLLADASIAAQCNSAQQSNRALHQLYVNQKWSEVVAQAQLKTSRTPDENFDLGMAQAHLQNWPQARQALLAGRRQCPSDKRFSIELAGIAFQQKQYPQAAKWIQKALRLDPSDGYANEFAGTVFLLMDNLGATLKYWNRIHRPRIEALQIDPQLRVQRLLLERAFVFSPQSILNRDDLLSSEARLNALGIFPAHSIKLDARSEGNFDAQFHALERNGFGDGWLQSSISTFSGVPYETIYPSYFNIKGSATNFDSLIRWDAQKRRIWFSFSGPVHYQPRWRWHLDADGRDENWAIRNSFTGTAPVLASFKLKSQVATANFTSIRSGRFQWTSGGELSHRVYSRIVTGSSLTPDLISKGFELKHLAGLNATVLDLPEHRFTVTASTSSQFARLWSYPPRLFEKLQGTATTHWLPQAEGNRYEFTQRFRGGGVIGSAPLDEFWMIGVERDTDLWLRGHIGTRDGRKGSSPIADRYFLSNSDFYRGIWGNGLISIQAGPFLDVARVSSPTPALAPKQWLFDTGAEVKLTVLGTSVVLTYGRDLRNGNNAFYGSAVQP